MKNFCQKDQVYTFLAAIFVTSLITGNMVFQKFVNLDIPFIHTNLHLSVGLFFFPITFIITDVISEIYGKEKAEYVVLMGLVLGVFVMLMMLLAQNISASSSSNVSDQAFNLVFGKYGYAILSSLIASFIAQIIDVRIFLVLKRFTNTKHLWLRNNISTISAQAFDTFFVVGILFYFRALPTESFWSVFKDSFCFKTVFAIIDTPIVYLLVFSLRKTFQRTNQITEYSEANR
jgi:queuosine precursor transporter